MTDLSQAVACYTFPAEPKFLILRNHAHQTCANIERTLAGDKVETLVVDVSAVEMVTNTWADAFIARVARDRHVVIKGANEEVREAIDLAVQRRQLTTVTHR